MFCPFLKLNLLFQVVAAMRQIMNRECAGLARIQRLIDNSRYFRRRLQRMGLIVYGDDDSPVIPVLLIMPSKIRAFVEELKVGFYVEIWCEKKARGARESKREKKRELKR